MNNKKPEITFIVTCGFYAPQSQGILDQIDETQSIEKIELILVEPDKLTYNVKRKEAFPNFVTLKYKDYDIYSSQLEAIKIATTDIVVLLEDHSKFSGDLVEDLLRIFCNSDYAAVGFYINLFDIKYVSLAEQVIAYGKFHSSIASGETNDCLAPNNLAYRREKIVNLLTRSLITSQVLLQNELLKQNNKFYFTNKVGINHFQYKQYSKYFMISFYSGWMYAGHKSKHYKIHPAIKLFYSIAVAVKPFIRIFQLRKIIQYHARLHGLNFFLLSSVILPGLLISSVGESFGYLLGIRKSDYKFAKLETFYDRNEK